MKAQIDSNGHDSGASSSGEVLCYLHTWVIGQRGVLGACLLQNFISQHSLCPPPPLQYKRPGSPTICCWIVGSILNGSDGGQTCSQCWCSVFTGVWFACVFPHCAFWFTSIPGSSSGSLAFLPSSATPIWLSTPPLQTTIKSSSSSHYLSVSHAWIFLTDCCCHGMF